jgi:hypothetical protein
MSWNGHPVIDLDSHIVERADRFYGDYLDPAYRDAYRQLCDAVTRQAEAGNGYSLFAAARQSSSPSRPAGPLAAATPSGLPGGPAWKGGAKHSRPAGSTASRRSGPR